MAALTRMGMIHEWDPVHRTSLCICRAQYKTLLDYIPGESPYFPEVARLCARNNNLFNPKGDGVGYIFDKFSSQPADVRIWMWKQLVTESGNMHVNWVLDRYMNIHDWERVLGQTKKEQQLKFVDSLVAAGIRFNQSKSSAYKNYVKTTRASIKK